MSTMITTYQIRYQGAPYADGEQGHAVYETQDPGTYWHEIRERARLDPLGMRECRLVGIRADGSEVPLEYDRNHGVGYREAPDYAWTPLFPARA